MKREPFTRSAGTLNTLPLGAFTKEIITRNPKNVGLGGSRAYKAQGDRGSLPGPQQFARL